MRLRPDRSKICRDHVPVGEPYICGNHESSDDKTILVILRVKSFPPPAAFHDLSDKRHKVPLIANRHIHAVAMNDPELKNERGNNQRDCQDSPEGFKPVPIKPDL